MTSIPPPGYEQRGPWGFEAPEQPRDPSRRLLQLAGALSVLLIALVAFAYLHGSSETSLNPIAEAAERTQEVTGARMTVTYTYTSPESSIGFVMRGEGVVNGRTERARVNVGGSVAGQELELEAVSDKHHVYMRSPELFSDLPAGKEWLGMEPLLGHSPKAFAAGGDVKQSLQMLTTTGGDVEEVGEETIDGVSTTQYRGTIDLDRVVSMLRREGRAELAMVMERLVDTASTDAIPVEVWIDGSGLVRRMRQIQPLPGEAGKPTLQMDMLITFSDFGIEPDIEIPPPSKVFDATPLLQAELGLIGKRKRQPPKSGATTLSTTRFRSRIGSICIEMRADFDHLEERLEAVSERAGETAKREGLASPKANRAFREVGARGFEPIVNLAEAFVDRLEWLKPPANLMDEYRRYLHLTEIQLDLLRAMTRAFEVADYRLIDRLDARIDKSPLESRLKRLARKLGASACEQDDD